MNISQAYNKTLELEGLLQLLKSENVDTSKVEAIFKSLFNKIDEIDTEISDLKQQFNAEITSIDINLLENDIEKIEENIDDIEDPEDDVVDNRDSELDQINIEIPQVVETETEIEVDQEMKADDDISNDSDDSSEPDIEVEFECVDVDVNQSAFALKSRGDIRKMFTLNDNFKFRRELFHNSQEQYSQALSAIEQMESMSEVEEHFYTELKWDKENPEVIEFMAIVTVYFLGR